MPISNIKIERILLTKGKDPLKALCNVSIADTFLILGLRIIQGHDGLFVGATKSHEPNGIWYDTFMVKDPVIWLRLEKMILDEYRKCVDNADGE